MLHFECLLPDDRDVDDFLTPESSLSRRELHTIVECMTVSFESTLTLRYFEGDIEIAISIDSTMTFSSDFDTHTILYTCGYLDIFFYEGIVILLPMTACAFLGDLLASSSTSRTYSSLLDDPEYCTYLLTDLSESTTSITSASFSSFSFTGFTESATFEFDLPTISTDRILKRYAHPDLDIISDICSSPTTSTTHPTSKK